MKRYVMIGLVFLSLWTGTVYAVVSPVDVLRTESSKVIAALNKNKVTIKTNKRKVYSIVRRLILPHFDVTGMSRSVLGRNAWRQATASQRSRFQAQFITMVIGTYSSALATYTNETIKYYPLRGGYAGKSRVQVNTLIIRPGGPAIPVNYRLILLGGRWRIYDFSVEGVSLLRSFRTQFSPILQQKGIGSIIA